MRLHESKFTEFLRNLPVSKKVFLLHGTVESKILYIRKVLERKLLGQQARKEMRLIIIDRGQLVKEKGLLINEVKTRSFFGGQKGILLENVSDKELPIIQDTLSNLEEEDPFLILTAGFLKQSSKLRKLIETNIFSCAVGFYQTETTSAEIHSLLKKWRVKVADSSVIDALRDFSKVYDFLEFRQELKKLALFKSFDDKPLSLIELENVFSSESNPDEKNLVDFLMQKDTPPIINYFRNHGNTIKNPVSIVIRAKNQFKILHKILCYEDDVAGILSTIWPPVLGKNRERLINTSKSWTITSIEKAIRLLRNIDLTLKGNSKISSNAILVSGFLEICLLPIE